MVKKNLIFNKKLKKISKWTNILKSKIILRYNFFYKNVYWPLTKSVIIDELLYITRKYVNTY